MKTKILITPLICAMALLASCTNDREADHTGGQQRQIVLAGVATRAAGDSNMPVNITAFYDDGQQVVRYIDEQPVYASGGLSTTVRNLAFANGTPYYPLGGTTLRFFGYTGNASSSGQLTLTSGTTDAHDVLFSNYGKREQDPDVNRTYEGYGTPGNAQDPVDILQFRHVMTKLDVRVEVDTTEVPRVNPVPAKVQFTMDGIAQTGEYSIYNSEPDESDPASAQTATNATGSYTVKLGTNYIVPNGTTLSGKKFNSLVIDNYTATAADRENFMIAADPTNTNNALLPGFAYELVITVRRLGVQGIKLTQVPWNATELTAAQPTYKPYTMNLDLNGGYINSGDDEIVKVVLYTADRVYVGGAVDGLSGIQYVTLPDDGVVRADLYTPRGLLLSADLAGNEFTNPGGGADAVLDLVLSPGGMQLADPGTAPGADNPYLITTLVQFLNLDKAPSLDYRLASNIDLASLADDNFTFNGFGEFTGTFDGDGHLISNANFSGPGLFSVNSGVIRGVRIYTGLIDVSGQAYAGAICGTNNGLIVGSINEASLVGSTATVGGICGLNSAGGTILACINTGDALDGRTLGGICGENRNSSTDAFAACINTGTMTSKGTTIGGIIGSSVQSDNTVVSTSFWLVGSVQEVVGGSELAVGTDNVRLDDVTDLEPFKLRDGIAVGEGPQDAILYKLNTELENNFPQWGAIYQYRLDFINNGLTWPAPVKL